ncbi:MAG TPA: DUF6493 family protein [Haliscomenobacter sp.]|uniref:DUF6493 family protein n=1 Tax=Haliscomenobacter sp. TaxID=2717303 RepID=UPI002C71AA43|nr:DUF6493 family protein [Haliscomenobacter sp.]HOY20851.1 DUF6493 family protein [Haliscomenobacter sp.]
MSHLKRHLKYIEGNSDKFWQIEVNGQQFTVVYGKNGTAGTSQTKTFDTDEACLKTAEKLVAEKLKKGYSEDGTVTVAASKAVNRPATEQKVALQEILDEYDHIIKTRNLDGLLPFLQAKSSGHLEGLRKHINKAKRYWMNHVDLTNEPEFHKKNKSTWGSRGDVEQGYIITLSAIALFDKSSISSWDEPFWFLNDPDKHKILLEALEWAKPDWLDTYILDKIRRNDWSHVRYSTLRLLEKNNLIRYNPELFARSLSRFEYRYSSKQSSKKEIERKLDELINDEITYQRDVPELFNYETNLHNQSESYRINNVGPYLFFPIWEYIYKGLLAENKIDRRFFIENALQLQTKDWNNNLKSFYRKRLEEIDLTTQELIDFQETIFAFFHAQYPPIASYGLDLCKRMYEHPDFNIPSFLEWTSALMMRTDCKAAIKSLLPIFEKIAKSKPEHQVSIAETIADVFMVPDMALQERAAKSLQKLGKLECDTLQEKLLSYLPQMQGNVKSLLDGWLDGASDVLTEAVEQYEYQPVQAKLLNEPLVLPDTWNDVLFQFGKFISSDEPHEAEILLNTFICKQHLFPQDYQEQMSPYFKQLERTYFEAVFKNEAKAFVMGKMRDLKAPYVSTSDHYTELHALLIIKRISKVAERKMRQGSNLPLLSLPTHLPYWIAPKVLLERIIAHQQADEIIDMADLSIAISRMCREDLEAALPLLPQLDEKLRPLMNFCLGLDKKMDLEEKTVLTKLMSWVSGNQEQYENLALWAVAARTFYPEETFNEFEKTQLREVPFVAQPFKPNFYFKESWNEWKNYLTKLTERSPSWHELRFDQPEYKKIPDHLLYSLNIHRGSNGWKANLQHPSNVCYWHSIMPQNPEPLALRLAASACKHTDYSSTELKGFLDIVNRPEFWFSELTTLVFACCFFQEKKDTRFMATEVLINSIEQRKLDVSIFGEKIAFLISGKYGALLRCIDALAAIKDVSAGHNLALFMILDTVFKNLNIQEKLPTNFKKLVEHYLDVTAKTQQQPSPEARAFFTKWKENASLKNLIKQII